MLFRFKTVYEHEVGLQFRHGKLVRSVGPGRTFLWSGQEIRTFDVRPRTITVGGQEVMTQDGATLKVSLTMTTRLQDARKNYMAQAVPERATPPWRTGRFDQIIAELPGYALRSRMESKAQILIREWIAPRTLTQAMQERAALADAIREPLAEAAKDEGLELLDVEVLDVNISGNIRAAYSDLLRAQLEGEAALQRARNEAATMRNLLNTARLVRDHPGLLELRALSSGQRPRVSVVINQAPPTSEPPAEVSEHPT